MREEPVRILPVIKACLFSLANTNERLLSFMVQHFLRNPQFIPGASIDYYDIGNTKDKDVLAYRIRQINPTEFSVYRPRVCFPCPEKKRECRKCDYYENYGKPYPYMYNEYPHKKGCGCKEHRVY